LCAAIRATLVRPNAGHAGLSQHFTLFAGFAPSHSQCYAYFASLHNALLLEPLLSRYVDNAPLRPLLGLGSWVSSPESLTPRSNVCVMAMSLVVSLSRCRRWSMTTCKGHDASRPKLLLSPGCGGRPCEISRVTHLDLSKPPEQDRLTTHRHAY
ncbi:hypothetical protein F4677DRAFT_311324, partial [Hypoxylon crocopeplum]